MTPEQEARVSIAALLQQAGRHVCDMANANLKRLQASRQSILTKQFSGD